MHLARKAYNTLHSSAVCIQTGMRVMVARNDLRFRLQTRAAILIQARTRIASTVKAIVDERIGNGEVSNKQGDFLQILLSANTLSDNEKIEFC
ncbi:hypothetical protein Scep_007317 [Stephania cephalantha]|uniref:Uncharacterized protein n=1 Tax=Stephania cephalantha TaxID=152367 RepID=A0AAP0KCB8_9MAGN